MKNETVKFRFTVPDGHPESGNKIEKSYDHSVCENDQEAVQTLKSKEWSLVDLVNDKLKASSRANAYQKALAAYQTSTASPEAIRERMIKDLIRSGMSEDLATTTINNALASVQK